MSETPARNADLSAAYAVDQLLPDVLPGEPMHIVRAWLHEAIAQRVQPNPNSMTLATVDADGTPSARVVLCKGMDAERGFAVFYTNREGRKGRALSANPAAALVFHWDTLDRQVRIEGPVTLSPDSESDAYFRSRPVESRIGAWASRQSEPIESREALLMQVFEAMERLGVRVDDPDAEVARPAYWGGYRVWARAVELWVGGPGRVHDRARWERDLVPRGDGFEGNAWRATRLQP